jgi:hypothetical protein
VRQEPRQVSPGLNAPGRILLQAPAHRPGEEFPRLMRLSGC